MLQNTMLSIGDSLIHVSKGAVAVLPHIIVSVIVFILGLVIASLLGKLIAELAKTLKVDALLSKVGVKEVLARAHISLNSGVFFATLVQWVVSFAFLLTSLQIIGFTAVTEFLTQILGYVPQVLTVGIIILLTAVVADALSKLVSRSALLVRANGAEVSGKVVKVIVWVVGVIMCLDTLHFPTELFYIVLTGIVAALSISFGLAFGLGGRDVAAKILQKAYDDMK